MWSFSSTLDQVSFKTYLVIGGTIVTSYALCRTIYLLCFHPLANYPGPRLAAVSNLWYAYHWLSGRYPWAIERVLEEYGDVVRIAPNELVFMKPEAQVDILMSGTKNRPTFIKTDFQHIGGKHAGIAADPDVEKHRAVRKMLAPAFNPRALKEQEPALHEHIDRFIQRLRELGTAERGVDMRDWFDWLACDIAGDMGYGHNFHNVRDGKAHLFLQAFRGIGLWGTLNQVMRRFPLLHPLVFLALPPRMAAILPTLLKTNKQIVRDRVNNRDSLKHPDYFSLLLPKNKPVPEQDFLVAQANHLIVGGFDPDTNLFTAAIFFLSEHRDTLQKLQTEIRDTFATYQEIQNEAVQGLPWLHAVIEETLRLHTNGAFGLPRISPGDTVDGHYIPAGCVVQTAGFAVTHSARYFQKPREFHPERFLPPSHPDYDRLFDADVKSAFKPFSMGPRGCIGQNMGYMQARILLAKMIWEFDWELLNQGEVNWERDLHLYAIWEKPPVIVRYTPVSRPSAGESMT
ncbi:cytochrome P450 [Aspergillus japonicus CBS 114.51]|uniref:Cytochrome P450 n=1 Tax=Aspergillus japonicus CBS 114.51 TaxID=1448312 RepID=A0A8T8WLQ3_ASPJA|nr:cytochrome P450 [Aspergillus japonicus CBS 114.51]RAH76706.1 cytochrome P450 [Aspergillus japonicus CBS 114.51]